MKRRTTAVPWVVAAAVLAACGALPDAARQDGSGRRPNILLIVADDMGFSDAGAFGGEMATPNIDALAAEGVMFTEFHVAPNCGPTRGSLLTGVDYHRAGMGGNPEVAADNQKGVPAYQGFLRDDVVTLAELLQVAGYHTSMAGKWHLGHDARNLPGGRGFERSFALLNGAASHWADQTALIPGSRTHYTENDQPVDELPADFYSTTVYTDRIIDSIDESAADDRPFFAYLSYTAPHNPLHAPDEAIEQYRGLYDAGWDALAAQRAGRLRELGLLGESQIPHSRPEWVLAWDELTTEQQAARSRDMEVYAGMIDRVDQNVGRLVAHLRETGVFDDTLILFLSDNGGCPYERNKTKDIPPGPAESYRTYDSPWANLSNTPFRLYKRFNHEGGNATPFIVRWPAVIKKGGTITHQIGHIIDVMATCIDIADTKYPWHYKGQKITKLEGKSLLPIFKGRKRRGHDAIFWEFRRNKAVRQGKWKLEMCQGSGGWSAPKPGKAPEDALPVQLYDLQNDIAEEHNLYNKRLDIADHLMKLLYK